MVIVPGPYHREFRETRSSMAAVRVNGLKAEPACLPVPPSPVARFTCDFCQLLPPYMARTSPVAGSMATTAACGSPGVFSRAATASSAATCIRGSRPVVTLRPPPNTWASPYLAIRSRLV